MPAHKMKKLSALLICFVMLACMAVPAYAASISNVKTNLPDISAEVKIPADSAEKLSGDSVKATLDGKELKTGDIEKKSASSEWIIMLDTSLSLSAEHFAAEKSAIKALYNKLGEKDTLSLYTFDSEVKQILSGKESKEDAVKKIDAVKANGQDTAFYAALTNLAGKAKASKADRVVPVIYTDGVETLKKGDREKTVEALKSSGVAIYGLYPDVTAKADVEALNAILKESGGKAESFSVKNASDKLIAKKDKAEETVVINFKADGPGRRQTRNIQNRRARFCSRKILFRCRDNKGR